MRDIQNEGLSLSEGERSPVSEYCGVHTSLQLAKAVAQHKNTMGQISIKKKKKRFPISRYWLNRDYKLD